MKYANKHAFFYKKVALFRKKQYLCMRK